MIDTGSAGAFSGPAGVGCITLDACPRSAPSVAMVPQASVRSRVNPVSHSPRTVQGLPWLSSKGPGRWLWVRSERRYVNDGLDLRHF